LEFAVIVTFLVAVPFVSSTESGLMSDAGFDAEAQYGVSVFAND
jgi:hypothetical protein